METNSSSLFGMSIEYNCSKEELPSVENRSEWSIICNRSLLDRDEAASCSAQEYYTAEYALIGTLFQTIIFFVGVLGNILVCTVVVKTRSMRTTTNCYLVSLAVADTITPGLTTPNTVHVLLSPHHPESPIMPSFPLIMTTTSTDVPTNT